MHFAVRAGGDKDLRTLGTVRFYQRAWTPPARTVIGLRGLLVQKLRGLFVKKLLCLSALLEIQCGRVSVSALVTRRLVAAFMLFFDLFLSWR